MQTKKSIKAVILCGGQGTRIRDASESVPKPMLRIGEMPVVWHIMKLYAHYGITDFVLCLGYKGWVIKEFFLNYWAMPGDITLNLGQQLPVQSHDCNEERDWCVTLAQTGEETQTGGRIISIKRYVENDDLFCVTYGDGVSNVDVGGLIDFHRSHGKIATVTAVHPPSRFGEMSIDGNMVGDFNEKPQVTEGYINGGFFVFDAKRIWDHLGTDSDCILEREPLQKLAQQSNLAAYKHNGFWQPMDTLREYKLLNEMWDTNAADWKVWK